MEHIYTCRDEFGAHSDHNRCVDMLAQMINNQSRLEVSPQTGIVYIIENTLVD